MSPRPELENNQDPQQKYAARHGVYEPPCHLICRCPFKCSGAIHEIGIEQSAVVELQGFPRSLVDLSADVPIDAVVAVGGGDQLGNRLNAKP